MAHKIKLAMKLARWHYTPVIIIPVVIGAVLAWYQGYPFRWVDFLICLVGAWFAHLGANAANDCFDHLSGVDRIAYETIPENRGSSVCGSEILTTGQLSHVEGFVATGIFFVLAAACGLPLFLMHGWPVAVFAISGLLLGVFYCARPIAFGYIGRGLGEVGIFIAFGILPVLGAYWVQTDWFSWSAILASIPPGLFTVSVLYNHHFTHAEADRKTGKISPVVAFGERFARMISPIILGAAYLSLIVNVVMGVFPVMALAGLLTAPFIFRVYARISVPAPCAASLNFLFNVVKTDIATGALIIAAMVIKS